MRNLCALLVVVVVVVSAGCFQHDYYNGGGGGGGGGPYPDAAPYPDAPPPCTPARCNEVGASCGAIADDGCGHPLDCGTCDGAAKCGGQGQDDVCAVPAANRQCVGGWCWEAPAPFPWTPVDAFARTTSDVWAVGGPLVQHFDGAAWSLVDVPTTTNLYAVWMASATDGWIVGDAGTLLRWNGTAWAKVTSGVTGALTGVHGSSASNVWFVGPGGTRKWNGSAVVATAATSPAFDRVFVSASHVFAIAPGANLYENVAGVWTKQVSGTSGSFFSAIAGNAAGTSVFAVGGDDPGVFQSDIDWVYQWNGSTWARVDEPGNGEYWDAFSDGTNVFASTEADVWTMATMSQEPGPSGLAMRGAVTGAGGDLFTFDGRGGGYHFANGSWTAPPATFAVSAHAMTNATAIGDAMWFASGGQVVEWNKGMVTHPLDSFATMRSIAGTSRADVWVVDDESRVHHFDGAHWAGVEAPVGADFAAVFATPALTFAMGQGGVGRWDPGTTTPVDPVPDAAPPPDAAPAMPMWVAEPVPASATWSAAAPIGATGDVVMIGNDATVSPAVPRVAKRAHATGAWTAMTAPAMATVCAVAARTASDIWVSGYDPDGLYDSGSIAHWDGQKWTVTKPTGAKAWCSLAFAANGDLWAATSVGDSEGGVVHHLVGATWTAVQATYGGDVRTVAFDATGTLWAGGDDGAILHR